MLFRMSKNLERVSPPVTWALLLVAYAVSTDLLLPSFIYWNHFSKFL